MFVDLPFKKGNGQRAITDKIVPISVMTLADIVLIQKYAMMSNLNVEKHIMRMMFMVSCMIACQMKFVYLRDVSVRRIFLLYLHRKELIYLLTNIL